MDDIEPVAPARRIRRPRLEEQRRKRRRPEPREEADRPPRDKGKGRSIDVYVRSTLPRPQTPP